MPRNVNIQLRRGMAAEWAAANPVLAAGEPGYETDTNTLKIGNGTSTYDALIPISDNQEGGSGGVEFGTTAGTACEGNDARLSDARDPNSHAVSHKSTGTDSIKLDELAAPDDITDLNATTLVHGLCPKLSGTSTEYLDGSGAWSTPEGGSGGTNLSYPGSSTVYLNGNGAWSTPTASGSVFKPGIYIGRTGSGADYICDGEDDHTQINQALTAATSGSTIYVLPGTYDLGGVVSQTGKSLNIIAQAGTVTWNITSGSSPGVQFSGTTITTQSLSANAAKGDITVTLASAALVSAGDIITVRSNELWCPDDSDYSTQKTGETYRVKGVSGNVVTLDEPLKRAYTTANSSQGAVYRPVVINVYGIRFQNQDSTGVYEGLLLSKCKDSTVDNCLFADNGQASIRLYTCYNTTVKNCSIYDCVHTGNGYGISIAQASAYIYIDHNRIENCRHCIMSGTLDFLDLNRDVVITWNHLYGANIDSSHVIDAHQMTLNYTVRDNHIFPYPGSQWHAFSDGCQSAIFENNTVIGGHGGWARRGTVHGGTRVMRNNYVDADILYAGIGGSEGVQLTIEGNTFTSSGQWYGVGLDTESYDEIVIKNNDIGNVTYRGIYMVCQENGQKITIEGNRISNTSSHAIHIDNTGYTNGQVKISDNLINNPNTANGAYAGIHLIYITYAEVYGNRIIDGNGYSGSAILADTGCGYNDFIGNMAKGMTGTKFSFAGSNNTDDNNISR